MTEEITNQKITFVGDSGSGKTSIITRYISDSFNPNQVTTIGASYFSKIITARERVLRLSIWDTAGQERFDSISSLYCRNSNAIILVCDARSDSSHASLVKWYNKAVKENLSEEVPIFIVINKMDLVTEDHAGFIQQIEEYGDFIRAPVIRTSAFNNSNIQFLFDRIIKGLLNTKSSMSRTSISLSSSRHSRLMQLKTTNKCC